MRFNPRLPRTLLITVTFVYVVLIGLAPDASARCKYQSLVRGPRPWSWIASKRAWAAGETKATITWYGHSFFRLVTDAGTAVAMDPFHEDLGLPIPDLEAHAITIGREHRNHNNVTFARGEPDILCGVDWQAASWRRVEKQVRDVRIFSVPVFHRAYWGELTNGSAFLFEVGDLCIAHLGDIGSELSPSQLEEIGKVDVAMVPIGGRFSADPLTARRIVEQLQPKIAIPMHYWDSEFRLTQFLQGAPRVHRLGSNHLTVTKSSLPSETTIIVMTY